MPIYEFRCLKCDHCFEFLTTNASDMVELKCEKCEATELERVVSKTNFVMTGGSGAGPSAASSTTRSCSTGSCTTYDIPGPR
ncbi:FmdB family zinc ribbon protein [Desulfatirhabdium butyrativorans]|uniref:FmdB family zinc ribbon protein n=1 Tax=Desulfatirhabdium butyrativorans TaxID=340467 RepID=UPI0003FDAE28|nr:zinc ribbon domain-containing protein [Desulfatirhabdium butyrativorans]